MKSYFFNSILSVFLIMLIILGVVPCLTFVADGQPGDSTNLTNSTPSANLILEKISSDPKVPEPNSSVTLSALVKNVGDAASVPTYIIYTIDNESGLDFLNSVDPGSEVTIPHIWTPDKEENAEITVSIEGVENSPTTIYVPVQYPRPDLTIQNIVPDPANPQEGEPLNFSVNVINQGTAPSGAVLATYYINGTAGQNISIPALNAGDVTNFAFSLTPDQVKAGRMNVKVVVDSGNTLNESNIANNVLTKTIYVKALPPDLTIDSLSWSPETPQIGENVTFTVQINNIGPGASPSSNLNYSISGTNESFSGEITVQTISAGATTQGTFTWSPKTEGNFEVNAVVNADNAVTENNTTNNAFTTNLTVTAATSSSGRGGESSSSGSSSGSSSSSSDMGNSLLEPAINVASKDLATRNVLSGNHIKFDFVENSTCITSIEYDAERTFGRTITTVEELKNKSKYVSKRSPGKIYKYENIYVGDKGDWLPINLNNGLVGFRVEKSWINSNNVNESLVTLQWYNNSIWQPLETEKVGEDDNFVYFRSKTPGFLFFAITEYTGDAGENKTGVGTKLQDTIKSLEIEGNKATNRSANNTAQAVRGAAKVLMAISLPIFLILVVYLVIKKKI
jgi:PGF-pre-PGF domain-containing protein